MKTGFYSNFFLQKKIQNQTITKQAGNIHLHWFYKGTRL